MIKDSGERREFESGAVRDIQDGKGRCDLLPLDIVADIIGDAILRDIADFQAHGDPISLRRAIVDFSYVLNVRLESLLLEVSKHYEEGAKKYGEYNWQRGLPVYCYIDSGVRHYLKWRRGDTDENHGLAFCWNILCCMWTVKHIEN